VVLRANDFMRAVDRFSGGSKLDPGSKIALTSLREALQDEPAVKEDEANRMRG
jgi:hypothetical protein